MSTDATNSTASTTGKQESSVVTRSVIRGTIPRSKLKPFVYLVRSLCPETGQAPEFREYDRVYNPSPEARAAPRQSIRLRTRLNTPRGGTTNQQVTLQYAGPPDRRAPANMERRPVTTVVVRDAEPFISITKLLTTLGCTLAYEYVRKVIRHRTRSDLYVDVFLIERLTTPGDPSTSVALPATSTDPREQHCVIEIWADDLPTVDPLLAFTQYLAPYVTIHSQQMFRRPL